MSHLNGAPLGHNPQADEAERLRVRETFDLKAHFGGAVPNAPPQAAPIVITKAQVKELANRYGMEVIESNPAGGRTQNLEEKLEALKADRDSLQARYAALTAIDADKAALIAKLVQRNNELAAEVAALKTEAPAQETNSNGNA